MSRQQPDGPWRCPGVTRRSFLADTGMGFTGLALGAMAATSIGRPGGASGSRAGGQGQGCHLDLPLWGRQPRREL